jgi:hypothetical protein
VPQHAILGVLEVQERIEEKGANFSPLILGFLDPGDIAKGYLVSFST